MVRITQFLPALAALTRPTLSTPVDPPPLNIDLINWWTKNIFICPLWRGDLPVGFRDLAGSICYNSQTKTYTHGTVTTRLYQIPGAWQQDDRYSEIINGAGSAIQKGLATFGSFVSQPLAINIGFAWGGLGDRVQIDSDNSGVKSPCYILINYPPSWVDIPLQALQKDIIQRMYQCVEQFHKPTVTTLTEANEWWRLGIARYFDGLSYPAKPAFHTYGLYPEEYHYGITLYQNDDAASLFFHFAQQQGWTPSDVNTWMKGHANKATYDQERTILSADTKITSGLWHKFILASIDGTIKYPNGQKITNTQGGPPKRTHSAVVDLTVGQNWSKTVSVSSFKGNTQVITFKAGQTLKVSMDPIVGVEWSIRKVGTTAWNSGDRARTVNVVVPAGANVKYEIALSSTVASAGSDYPRVLVKRSA